MDNHDPPPAPPPYVSPTDLDQLATNGHLSLPLPPALAEQYTQLFTNAKSFFALPLDQKQTLYPSPPQSTEQGYTHIANEKEFLTIRHNTLSSSSSTSPPNPIIDDQITAIWHSTAHLLYRVLADLSAAIDIDIHAWDPLLDGCLSLPETEDDATPSLLRVFRYDAGSGTAERHRDLGLLTLCVCAGRGLQVLDSETGSDNGADGAGDLEGSRGKVWKDAPEVTVLVGDSLWLLSRGRIRAGIHRVVPNDEGRMSIVFALRMATRHDVDTRPFGGEEVVRSADLWDRIWRSRVNVNAQKDVREEQKRRRRERDVC